MARRPSSTYKIIRQKLADLHRIRISDATLSRYNERRVLAEETIDHADSAQTIRTFIAIQNAEPVAYDTAGLALIQKRAFNAACAPRITVPILASLQRIFNYNAARGDIEHRKQIADRKTAVAEGHLALQREKLAAGNSKLAQRPLPPGHYVNEDGRLCDNLGPIAQNLQEINDRVRKQFGITPEESARRAELRKTWKNPNIPKYLRTNPQPSVDAVPSTHAPNPSTGGTNSVSPTPNGWCDAPAELSRAAIHETPAAPADQPTSHIARTSSPCVALAHKSPSVLPASDGTVSVPLRQDKTTPATGADRQPSIDPNSPSPDALPTPTLNLNPNTSNASNCVSISEFFAAALTSTPVAADVRRLTSSSRDAGNETTTTPADQKSPSFPLPAGDEDQGEGFNTQPIHTVPADPSAPTSTPNSAAPNSESLIPDSELATKPQTLSTLNPQRSTAATLLPYPPNTIPPHEAAYFKAIGAQAAAALNEFNARRTNTNPESENENAIENKSGN